MKNIKRILSIVTAGVLAISLSSCGLVEKTPEAIAKTTVAKINSEKITKGELDKEMEAVLKQIAAQYGPEYATTADGITLIKDQKLLMLDELINNKLFGQKAKELKLIPEDKELQVEIDKKYTEIKGAYPEEAKWKEALDGAGFTEEKLKEYLKGQVINSKVSEYMVKDVTVTDEEVNTYYQSHTMDYTEKQNTITMSHIIVAPEDEAKANEIKKKLDGGADFAALAKENNIDGTKETGGVLGEINQNEANYDATFMAAALKLKKGETSGVVKTQFGFHIIYVSDRKDYPVKAFDTVKDEVKEIVLNGAKQKKYTETLDKWKTEGNIKKYEDKI